MNQIEVPSALPTAEAALHHIVAKSYDIATDDRMLRGITGRPPERRGDFFTKLRAEYRERHEFASTAVHLPRAHAGLASAISALGFNNQLTMSNRKILNQ